MHLRSHPLLPSKWWQVQKISTAHTNKHYQIDNSLTGIFQRQCWSLNLMSYVKHMWNICECYWTDFLLFVIYYLWENLVIFQFITITAKLAVLLWYYYVESHSLQVSLLSHRTLWIQCSNGIFSNGTIILFLCEQPIHCLKIVRNTLQY